MYSSDESSIAHYNRNAKYPRLSRMHRDGDSRSKQPRALEDGNWVCEDPECNNVNYPRRIECNKCGKRRGQLGDAVVRAYMEGMKIARGELHPSALMARGIIPHNSAELAQAGMISSASHQMLNDPWMGRSYDQYAPFVSEGFSGRSPALRAAKDGKRLAEQLVASFSASPDPFGDANECLASAQMWLQTVKSRMQAGECNGASPPLGSLHMPLMNALDYSRGGGYYPRSSGRAGPLNLRYEDYKDRPSDFLREFGDPAAVTAATMGGGLKPEPGVNGNWECEECKNVNFPRRTSCFQCHKKRGIKGDEIVRDYVRKLIEET